MSSVFWSRNFILHLKERDSVSLYISVCFSSMFVWNEHTHVCYILGKEKKIAWNKTKTIIKLFFSQRLHSSMIFLSFYSGVFIHENFFSFFFSYRFYLTLSPVNLILIHTLIHTNMTNSVLKEIKLMRLCNVKKYFTSVTQMSIKCRIKKKNDAGKQEWNIRKEV